MKKRYQFITLLTCVWVFAGCAHDSRLFVNPTSPTSASAPTLLTSAEVATINTYEGDLTRTAGILIQHGVGADGQASAAQVYAMPQQLFDNQWSQIYQTLLTLKLLKDDYGTANPYYKGVADILMAMNWGLATDLWGDIPYSQALNLNLYPHPVYDAQQTVLQNITGLLDSSIAILSDTVGVNALSPAGDDVIFGGNTANWIATAYTLKARYLNRLSNKSNYDPATILTCLANGIQSSSQDCMGIHGADGSDGNQWYEYISARGYIVAAEPLVDSISLRPTDQRLNYFFDATQYGSVVASPVANPTLTASYWGPYIAGSESTPTPLVTHFEALFIKAEVEARTGSPAAATDLNAAIVENCTKVTGGIYTGADIATYTAGNTNLHAVMYEKWIAMFGTLEPYNDYRRTGYPMLTPNPNGNATGNIIPKRYPTPDQESNYNPNAAVVPITTPVWWAQ